MKQILDGTWEFRAVDDALWQPAQVPGCNYLDLLANGRIPDPFYGLNEADVAWVAEKDWIYRKRFTLTKEQLAADEITLSCRMLDTICEVFVNDCPVGSGQNCHVEYRFPVQKALKEGENEVCIVFTSPVRYVRERYAAEGAPVNSNGQNGIVHIRKPQYHFGWDWGPVLPPSGISGEIALDFVQGAAFEDLAVTQQHKDGSVTLSVDAQRRRYREDAVCQITVTAPDGSVLYAAKGDSADVLIEQPQLWWTRELSQKETQPLYTVAAELLCDGVLVARIEKTIGLRTITLNRDRDAYGSNFQFILNGVPLFIKGANYIPGDSFMTRFDEKQYENLLDAVCYSNMNMIRVWGGGFYADDRLLSLCDRRGILIWQDFQFACQAYPFFKPDFLENVKAEIACNVRRLRTHPSLALWCGNNEIEAMSGAWLHMKKYIQWTKIFFYDLLEPALRQYDPATPFIPGSPCGAAPGKGINSDNVGDTHLWGVWHGLQPMTFYRKRPTRFCSEFGFESLPNEKTVLTFASPDDCDIASPVFSAHQKCATGNEKMLWYIHSRFRMPQQFADLIYLSQVTQQECIADATEHWRRNKGRCNGAIYWQLNDCWPVCSWSSYDYYGGYKALQYTARMFNAPCCVSIEKTKDDVRLWLLNDLNVPVSATLRWSFFDFERGVLEQGETAVSAGALENVVAETFLLADLKARFDLRRCGLCVQLWTDDGCTMEKTCLFDMEKRLHLPKVRLTMAIEAHNGAAQIRLRSDGFARLICLESSEVHTPFSENYFDLLPYEEKTVYLPLSEDVPVDVQLEAIRVRCLNNMQTRAMTAGERLRLTKMQLSPMNIGSRFFHGTIPPDYKYNDQ